MANAPIIFSLKETFLYLFLFLSLTEIFKIIFDSKNYHLNHRSNGLNIQISLDKYPPSSRNFQWEEQILQVIICIRGGSVLATNIRADHRHHQRRFLLVIGFLFIDILLTPILLRWNNMSLAHNTRKFMYILYIQFNFQMVAIIPSSTKKFQQCISCISSDNQYSISLILRPNNKCLGILCLLIATPEKIKVVYKW